MTTADALEIVRSYSRMQAALVRVWTDAVLPHGAEFEGGVYDLVFHSTPRQGSLQHAGKTWEFTRHGAGVRFESADAVLDPHVEITTEPTAVDAWRLLQFCESRGIEALTFEGERFDATDDRRLNELLGRLHAAGHVRTTDHKLFIP